VFVKAIIYVLYFKALCTHVMGLCLSMFVKPAPVKVRLQTIPELYDAGTDIRTIPIFTTTSASSDAYKEAVRECCLYAGPQLRKEYLVHFAQRGTLHATEYEALGFSLDGFGKIPSVLGQLSEHERSDVLRDYGRAVYGSGRCTLHTLARVILRHRVGASSNQQRGAHIVVDVIRDVLHTSRDPETVLLDGVAAAVRAADIELTSLFLAHIECSDVNDVRRRRLIAHLLTTCLQK